jgi:hypothetical protein
MGKYMVAADSVLGVCSLPCSGMDVYNRHFGNEQNKDTDIFHDDFYTNGDIVDAYSRYVSTIVKRYADEPSVLGTPLSVTCCCGCTHRISRLGTRQRPTLFLRPACVEELHASDYYSMGCDHRSSREAA